MAAAFDSLKFTQRLEDVGVPHETAVRHAELARDMLLADLITRDDFEKILKAELVATKYEIVRTLVLVQLAALLVMLLGLFFR